MESFNSLVTKQVLWHIEREVVPERIFDRIFAWGKGYFPFT